MEKFGIISLLLIILVVLLNILINARITTNSSFEIPSTLLTTNEQNAPFDRIPEKNIEVYDDKIIIKINNASLSKYADTDSMVPLLDSGSNGIRIVPKSEEDIKVGDIISFESSQSQKNLIVHRVIEISYDNQGKYFITKGDNSLFKDGKIRFKQIKYITVGIIY